MRARLSSLCRSTKYGRRTIMMVTAGSASTTKVLEPAQELRPRSTSLTSKTTRSSSRTLARKMMISLTWRFAARGRMIVRLGLVHSRREHLWIILSQPSATRTSSRRSWSSLLSTMWNVLCQAWSTASSLAKGRFSSEPSRRSWPAKSKWPSCQDMWLKTVPITMVRPPYRAPSSAWLRTSWAATTSTFLSHVASSALVSKVARTTQQHVTSSLVSPRSRAASSLRMMMRSWSARQKRAIKLSHASTAPSSPWCL
mmetsp:Transcript_87399/g.155007  ORF Transcript_87399/g.155007 Transcript_87399/m.155007 type:complete len:255 (-) Transcript_87399:311-1075(-)